MHNEFELGLDAFEFDHKLTSVVSVICLAMMYVPAINCQGNRVTPQCPQTPV